ncbi:MAG: hypothetical protein JO079_11155 [Frankiaceae bacterium]|nr:hypothetical protein [Frankiaceae bacterium]
MKGSKLEQRDQQAVERLMTLADQEVWLSVVRGSHDGGAVVRRGTLRLEATEDEIRKADEHGYEIVLARVLDEANAPLAIRLSSSSMHLWNDVLRLEPRLSFVMDVVDR